METLTGADNGRKSQYHRHKQYIEKNQDKRQLKQIKCVAPLGAYIIYCINISMFRHFLSGTVRVACFMITRLLKMGTSSTYRWHSLLWAIFDGMAFFSTMSTDDNFSTATLSGMSVLLALVTPSNKCKVPQED